MELFPMLRKYYYDLFIFWYGEKKSVIKKLEESKNYLYSANIGLQDNNMAILNNSAPMGSTVFNTVLPKKCLAKNLVTEVKVIKYINSIKF